MADVSPSVAACMSDMASEILTLRARLAEAEAERDTAVSDGYVDALRHWKAKAQNAEARLAEVEAERDRLRRQIHNAKSERCTDESCECCDLIPIELRGEGDRG